MLNSDLLDQSIPIHRNKLNNLSSGCFIRTPEGIDGLLVEFTEELKTKLRPYKMINNQNISINNVRIILTLDKVSKFLFLNNDDEVIYLLRIKNND